MIYHKINDKILLSKIQRDHYPIVTEEEARNLKDNIFIATNIDPKKSRKTFAVTDPSLLFLQKEDLSLLKINSSFNEDLPNWLLDKINKREVTSVNATYPNWEMCLQQVFPTKWRVNIVGLGDVGGTLGAGLKLLGSDCIKTLGLYDRDENKTKRWEYEIGQILSPTSCSYEPEVISLKEDEIFDCDIFVFCVSIGVPEIGKEAKDVRLAQFEGNSKIISYYSKVARKKNFKGIFAVVSDPVDLLCKVVFEESNKDNEGNLDFKGLAAEQIRGYGLGVMNGRAAFYAGQNGETKHYLKEGRAFGPHGEGLIIADSIENYNEKHSNYLTEKAKSANLEVRKLGFKPFVAPALSSGSLSLIATMKGEWNYSSTFIGGTFIGSKNRLLNSGVELETYNMPEKLFNKLENTYDYLNNIL